MKATLYLIIAAFMWGFNFHLLKIMLSSVHFIEAGFWRYLFGVFALGIYIRNSLPEWHVFKKHIKGILIVGVLGLFCFNILLFWGMKYTSSLNASLIISLNPLVTLFLASFFLKSKLDYRQLIGGLIGIVGVVYLLSKGDLLNLSYSSFSKGDLLILGAMFLSAFYHIWVKKYTIDISNKHFTFLSNLMCLICFISIIPFNIAPHSINYSMQFWFTSIVFGVFGTAFTYILWNKGLQIIGASRAGVFMNIVPLSTAIIAVILGKELTKFHLFSGILIFLGLVISQRKTVSKNV
ncbi:MAG: DMT family transporter [Aureispira sp.]